MLPLLPGNFYHIYNHANGNECLFVERENYRYFLQQTEIHLSPIADLIAYCLMPNHFHFLIYIQEERSLNMLPLFKKSTTIPTDKIISKQFANLFSSYTQSFNKVYMRRGSLFIKNFKRKKVHDSNYLKTLITYIHLNPVHHHFVANLNDWEWSSYLKYCHADPLPPLIAELFGNHAAYEKYHLDRIYQIEGVRRLEFD